MASPLDSSKVTPWFPVQINPVHIGVYEIGTPASGYVRFSYWNGKRWRSREASVEQAYIYRTRIALGPVLRWRGLVSPIDLAKNGCP